MPRTLQILTKIKKILAMQKLCLVIQIKTHKLRESETFRGGIQRRTFLFFQFGNLIELAKELPSTKVIASVYDPIGFISPFVIPMKILFQDLCFEN